jgi:hypothetical protein
VNEYTFILESTNRTKRIKWVTLAYTLLEAEDDARVKCGELEIEKGGYWSLVSVTKVYS